MLALGPFVSARAARHVQIDQYGRQMVHLGFELLRYVRSIIISRARGLSTQWQFRGIRTPLRSFQS
jgi:hypothetical protein